MPPEYNLIQAAKYLGVAPWDLAERSASWTFAALEAKEAEARARGMARKAQQRAMEGK